MSTNEETSKPTVEQKGLREDHASTLRTFVLMSIFVFIAPLILTYLGLQLERKTPDSIPQNLPTPLEVMRIPATAKQTSTVIFLHGLGDTGSGWKFLADTVQQTPGFSHTGFVLPTAPTREITLFQEKMTAWFNIITPKVRCDYPNLIKSLKQVKDLVNQEIENGIPPERIILGGFSQGGAMAQASAVTLDQKLGGFIAVSGYLPRPELLKASGKNLETPFLIQHGDSDPMVDITLDEAGIAILKEQGFEPDYKVYEGVEHTLSQKGLQDLMAFLDKVLN